MFLTKNTLFIILIVIIASCNENKNNVETENELVSDLVQLSETQKQYAQIEIGKIEKKAIEEKVHVNGIISLPIDGVVSISPAIGGFLKELLVLPGQQVNKGQTLALLEHRDYIELQQKFLQTKSNVNYLANEYKRQKNLVDQNAATEKTFEKIESEYNSFNAELSSLENQLKLLGINPINLSPENISNSIALKAPESGYIGESEFNIGRYIGAEEVIFDLLCNRQMQLELNVFEKDILKISKDQKVTFRLASDNSKKYSAKVILAGRVVDQETKTIPVYCKFNEHYKFFRHGMKVSADIITFVNETYAIPEFAVIKNGKEDNVFIQINDSTFKKVSIQTGSSSEGYIAIENIDSLLLNSAIVMKGANYIEAEI